MEAPQQKTKKIKVKVFDFDNHWDYFKGDSTPDYYRKLNFEQKIKRGLVHPLHPLASIIGFKAPVFMTCMAWRHFNKNGLHLDIFSKKHCAFLTLILNACYRFADAVMAEHTRTGQDHSVEFQVGKFLPPQKHVPINLKLQALTTDPFAPTYPFFGIIPGDDNPSYDSSLDDQFRVAKNLN